MKISDSSPRIGAYEGISNYDFLTSVIQKTF